MTTKLLFQIVYVSKTTLPDYNQFMPSKFSPVSHKIILKEKGKAYNFHKFHTKKAASSKLYDWIGYIFQ